MDNDSLARENTEVPVVGGLGRIAVPAGNYSVASFFPRYDDVGDLIDMRAVSPLDVTVPASGGPTHVALDARTATSTLKVSTPRATNLEVQALDVVRVDATGLAASDSGFVSWSTAPILVAPEPKPTVGRVQLRARFDAVAAVPSDDYRYDLAFGSDHIDADQTYAAQAGKLATVHHRFFTDPAGQPTGSLLAGPADTSGLTDTDELSGFTTEPMPGQSTEYVETFPGSLWAESFGNFGATAYAEPRSFAAGGDYDVDWLHGPLAPTLGQHSGLAGSECDMCVAGPVTTLAYEPTGDSAPDQFGFSPRSLHFTGYVHGQSAVDADDAYGMVVDAASAGHYAAAWPNPASPAGVAPMLKVTATDTLGGSITQTITNAYTLAPAGPAEH